MNEGTLGFIVIALALAILLVVFVYSQEEKGAEVSQSSAGHPIVSITNCPKCGRKMTKTTAQKSYCMKCDILIHTPSGVAYTGNPEEDQFIGVPAVLLYENVHVPLDQKRESEKRENQRRERIREERTSPQRFLPYPLLALFC